MYKNGESGIQNFSGNFLKKFFQEKYSKNSEKNDEFVKDGVKRNEDVKCSIPLKRQRKISDAISLKMPDTIGAEADFYTVDEYGIKKVDGNSADVLIKENGALKYLALNGVLNIPRTKGIFFDDGAACLVTDIKAGAPVDIEKGLSFENVENLFKIFFQMDKALFLHNDLHRGNILAENGRVSLIDFGDFLIVGDDGEIIGAKSVDFNKNVTFRPKKRLQKLISKAARGEKSTGLNYSDNPNLPFGSNVSNFEYRFLSSYLKRFEDVDNKGAKQFFSVYLNQKGRYYKKRAEYYNGLVASFGNELGKNYLRQAVLYDMAASNVLRSKNKDAIQIERIKMDFKAALYEAKEAKNRHGALEKDTVPNLKKEYFLLIKKIDEVLKTSFDNDLILYAEALNKIYLNPYWAWKIESLA